MISYVVSAAKAYGVKPIAISANGNQDFAPLGLPLLNDPLPGYEGPLAALLAGLLWVCEEFGEDSLLLSLPCDVPLLPPDLLNNLQNAMLVDIDATIASYNGILQPTIGLWRCKLADQLTAHLNATPNRSMKHWLQRCRTHKVDYAAEANEQLFTNINTPEDLADVERTVKHQDDPNGGLYR
jgi:molybdopterin-guanine dinucleotide biosynthesis protein A